MSIKLQKLNKNLSQRQKDVDGIRHQMLDIKKQIEEEVRETLPTLGIFRQFKWISIEQEGIIEDNAFMFMPNIYDDDMSCHLQRCMSELVNLLNSGKGYNNSLLYHIDNNTILKSYNESVCIDVYYEKGLPNIVYYNKLKNLFNKYGMVLNNATQTDYVKHAEYALSKAHNRLKEINKLIEIIRE